MMNSVENTEYLRLVLDWTLKDLEVSPGLISISHVFHGLHTVESVRSDSRVIR